MKKQKKIKKNDKCKLKKFVIRQIGTGSEISFSVGIGSLLGFYLIEFCKLRLAPLSSEFEQIVMAENTKGIYLEFWEGIIFMIGFVAVLVAPLLSQWKKGMGTKITMLIALIVINIGGVLVTIVQGRVPILYGFVIWFSSVFISWFCIGILKILYSWLRTDKETMEQFNVVKLTLIWTIIAFLLGKIM